MRPSSSLCGFRALKIFTVLMFTFAAFGAFFVGWAGCQVDNQRCGLGNVMVSSLQCLGIVMVGIVHLAALEKFEAWRLTRDEQYRLQQVQAEQDEMQKGYSEMT